MNAGSTSSTLSTSPTVLNPLPVTRNPKPPSKKATFYQINWRQKRYKDVQSPITMKSLMICALFVLPFKGISQDITGLWKGTLINDSTGQSLSYVISITREKGKYTGYSH